MKLASALHDNTEDVVHGLDGLVAISTLRRHQAKSCEMVPTDEMPTDSFDAVFALSEELVQSPNHKFASVIHVDFDGLLQRPLRLHEDLAKGCGGQLWPAGIRLAKFLLREKCDELRNASMYGCQYASGRSGS